MKFQLGNLNRRFKCRWQNIKMGLKEIGYKAYVSKQGPVTVASYSDHVSTSCSILRRKSFDKFATTIFLEKPTVSHARNNYVLRSFRHRFPVCNNPPTLLYVDNSSITISVEGLFQYYLRAQFAASKLIFSLRISFQILISPMSAAFYTCLS